jgi:hypothetical protein
MKASIKNKRNENGSTLTSLYLEYERTPSEKLERKILQLESEVPKGKFLTRKNQAISAILKSPGHIAGIYELESFFYLEQREKDLLFRHYLYHSKESNRIIKALSYFLGQINTSSKESLPSLVSEKDFSVLNLELEGLESLLSSADLSVKDRIHIFHGLYRNGHLFELQNIHIQWLSSRCSKEVVCCLLEIYLTGLKYSEFFDLALDFFKLQSVKNLQLLNQRIFFGFYFQFSLMRAFQSEAWIRRKVISDLDRERLLALIDDENFLKTFGPLSSKEQNILRQLIVENTHTSRYSEVVSQNSVALLDLQVYDLKTVKAADILAAVSLRLKAMPFGKETPRKVLGAQRILLDENFKHLGNICYGYSFLPRS